MKIFCTGQIGLDKYNLLADFCKKTPQGCSNILLFPVGRKMYEEFGHEVRPGKILNKPLSELRHTRRSVMKDAIRVVQDNQNENIVINSHSTFRWQHGLFFAFDFDQLGELNADTYVTLIDDVHIIKGRFLQNPKYEEFKNFRLKDIIVWREEEILTTELIANHFNKPHYIVAREQACDILHKLIFSPTMKKVYLSFPITRAKIIPEVWTEIEDFRKKARQLFITFDPFAIKEKILLWQYEQQNHPPETLVKLDNGNEIKIPSEEITEIKNDIDGQIISRDFMLIERSDLLFAYIPHYPNNSSLEVSSPGLQREIDHAYSWGRFTVLIWRPTADPSVWLYKQVSCRVNSLNEALEKLKEHKFIHESELSADS